MNKKRHVIIGASAAAMGVINKLRQLDTQCEIVCISAESELPYNKCFLADFVSGAKTQGQIQIFTTSQQQEKRVQLLLNTRVERIVPENKEIIVAGGSRITYDTLFIGTGSSPFFPPITGVDTFSGIFHFHTLNDSLRILDYARKNGVTNIAIVGAGLSGVECADALHAQGFQITIIEMADRLLPSILNKQASDFIKSKIEAAGVAVHIKEKVTQLLGSQGAVSGLVLASGTVIPATLVIFTTGMRPNSTIAQEAGIACQKGAIVTDECMRTNVPDIYAGGDVALVKDQLSGSSVISCTWPDAMMQGMIAAQAMAGTPKAYPGVIIILSSSFFGLKLASTGSRVATNAGLEKYEELTEDGYTKILSESKIVKEFTLLGTTIPLFAHLKRSISSNAPLTIDLGINSDRK